MTRRNGLTWGGFLILKIGMRRGNFLDADSRQRLLDMARDGSSPHRLSRRANGLLLLDGGMGYEQIAKVLFVDDDTVRTWREAYERDGMDSLTLHPWANNGCECRLSADQQESLAAWMHEVVPPTTREVGAWIAAQTGVVYTSRSGLSTLLGRLGFEYKAPKVVPRELDVAAQEAFIKNYNVLLNGLEANETVVFADAVHPTHAARSAGCWVAKNARVAIEQTSGRQRLNIHGALDLESGNTQMIDVETIDAHSTIALLSALENRYKDKAKIHVFLDNARYHHARTVQEWLSRPDCRIKLHFLPAYCPHLNPIERLWGLTHKHVTHNRCYRTFSQFATTFLTFLRTEVPKKWTSFRDTVSDNFRIINPQTFRLVN